MKSGWTEKWITNAKEMKECNQIKRSKQEQIKSLNVEDERRHKERRNKRNEK